MVAPPIYVQPAQQQDFFETMRKLWRHRSIIVASTMVFAVIGTAAMLRLPSYYVAEARVLVGVPSPRVLSVDAIIADMSPDAERVQNEGLVLQSRDLARDVVGKLRLTENPEFNPQLRPQPFWQHYIAMVARVPSMIFPGLNAPAAPVDPAKGKQRLEDQVAENLLQKLDVSPLGRSHVLSVQARSEDPDLAAAIANSLVEAYLAQQRKSKIDATEQAESFLAGRIAELRSQVEKSQQLVEDYRKRNGLFRGASAGVTSQQLTELNTQLILAQTAKAEADARLGEAQTLKRSGGNSGESAPEVLRSPTIQALKQQQADAERRAADLAASYGEQHPKMVGIRGEIADARRKIQLEIARQIESLQHEARAAGARYEALQQSFNRLQTQMGGVNEKSIQLDSLERDATVNRNLLEHMLTREKETIGQDSVQQPNARIISPAMAPLSPSFPPKSLIAFLGSTGGLLLGVVIALMRENLDHTFRRSDQIEKATGLPVLSMVPSLRSSTAPTLHVLRWPLSPFSESLRKLYVGLELSETAQSPKSVLFGSSAPGEGKSMMVASLGRMLASNGRRVLLIDCDWRCPSLHRLFHCSNRGGLATLLSEDEPKLSDIVFNDALSGVDVIVAGDLTAKSMHLLTSERMQVMLRVFAKNYDLVILDTPPVLVGAEVLNLARMVDKVVFAVRWGHTPREMVLDALKQIVETGGEIAGVVLSRVDSKRYQNYGYGQLSYHYTRPELARLA